ncbi:MAG: hypothetical protein K0A92_06950 [Methyloprofundus sp.]|nr:hypothetical protein [Methyloprofundus sp.]
MRLKKLNSISYERKISGITTLITALILLTPMCGFLFQCGCDWPWSGLDARCNFYKPHAEHQCPWCVSMLTGVLATGLAILVGVFIAMMPLWQISGAIKQVSVRTVLGLSAFFVMAIVAAILAAIVQHYPLGISQYLV